MDPLAARHWHGSSGEWRVSRQRLRWDILDAFADATAQTGFPRIDDFDTGENAGVSYFDVNQRRGLRVSLAKTLPKPVLARANLTVWTQTLTERVTTQRDATGVPGDADLLRAAGGIANTTFHPVVRHAWAPPMILAQCSIATCVLGALPGYALLTPA